MDHAEVREPEDPTELGTKCKGEANIHASSEGERMTVDTEQIAQGVAHEVLSGVLDLEVIDSPDCLVSVRVMDAAPSRDFQVQLQVKNWQGLITRIRIRIRMRNQLLCQVWCVLGLWIQHCF